MVFLAAANNLMVLFLSLEWFSLCLYILCAIDYEVANYYLSTHPDSHFRHHLFAARSEPGRRYGLFDNQLSIHTIGGASEKRTLASLAEIRAVLAEQFRITLPHAPELDAALARLL